MNTPDRGGAKSARRPRPKPERRIRWLVRPAGDSGVLQITVGERAADYGVRELRTDFGRGFELTRFGPDPRVYHVLIDQAEGRHSCECDGFLRWNRCKHVEGLLALAVWGRLTTRPAA